MNSFLEIIKALWSEIDSVLELIVYLSIAYGIHAVIGITYMESIGIVFIYFILNLLRIIVEIIRIRSR